MKRISSFAILLSSSILFFPRWSEAAMERHFALQKTSSYLDGCFAPCLCPVLIQADLRGRFSMVPAGTENGYEVYDVNDIQWMVTLPDGSTILVRGSGIYRSSKSEGLQRLELDLTVGDRLPEHYNSGLVPVRVDPPLIDITVSKNGQYCRDTVFHILAAPAPSDVRPPRLQVEQEGVHQGALITWGWLKTFWSP